MLFNVKVFATYWERGELMLTYQTRRQWLSWLSLNEMQMICSQREWICKGLQVADGSEVCGHAAWEGDEAYPGSTDWQHERYARTAGNAGCRGEIWCDTFVHIIISGMHH